jgi:hypothetical protein
VRRSGLSTHADMFIRRTRVHPLSTTPTPVARRRLIRENMLSIFVPKRLTPLRERLSSGAALVGRVRESGATIQIAEANVETLGTYPARLRRAATRFLAVGSTPAPIQVLPSEVEPVGRYDATLHRIERIERAEPLSDWLGPEAIPVEPEEPGNDYLMRLWEEVILALGLPPAEDSAALPRSIKQLVFLAEDYRASGVQRGADELSMLVALLESRAAAPPQPKTE